MSCSGLCETLEHYNINQPLKEGQKKCRICKKIFETENFKCQCCKNLLSTRSRTKQKILIEVSQNA